MLFAFAITVLVGALIIGIEFLRAADPYLWDDFKCWFGAITGRLEAMNNRVRNAWSSPNMPHASYETLHAPGMCTRCDRWPSTQKQWADEGREFTFKDTPDPKPAKRKGLAGYIDSL